VRARAAAGRTANRTVPDACLPPTNHVHACSPGSRGSFFTPITIGHTDVSGGGATITVSTRGADSGSSCLRSVLSAVTGANPALVGEFRSRAARPSTLAIWRAVSVLEPSGDVPRPLCRPGRSPGPLVRPPTTDLSNLARAGCPGEVAGSGGPDFDAAHVAALAGDADGVVLAARALVVVVVA
jgi:hypothetical protein